MGSSERRTPGPGVPRSAGGSFLSRGAAALRQSILSSGPSSTDSGENGRLPRRMGLPRRGSYAGSDASSSGSGSGNHSNNHSASRNNSNSDLLSASQTSGGWSRSGTHATTHTNSQSRLARASTSTTASSRAIDRASETNVQRLITGGMSVHSRDAARSLASAARIGDLGMVRAFANAGVPLDAVYHDSTAIMTAAKSGQLEVVQFLARHRANVDYRAADGTCAVFLACQEGHLDVVRYLLHRKANADVATATGKSALHAAVQGGHEGIVAELLQHWADTQRVDTSGKRAREYVTVNHIEIARMLDAHDRRLALLTATAKGELSAVEYLVARGDDLETRGPLDETALLVAANGGHIEIARVLLNAGADRTAALQDGSSALHLAVKAAGARGGADMVRLLLENGVDSRSVDANGNQAREYANDPHVLQTLDRYTDRLRLLFAVEAGDLTQVVQHVSHGATLETRRRVDGATPLLAATLKGYVDIVHYLLESGADVNAAATTDGITSLHVAAQQDDRDILEYLLDFHADVSRKDADGKLPRDYVSDDYLLALLDAAADSVAEGSDGEDETTNDNPTEAEEVVTVTPEPALSPDDADTRRADNGTIPILGEKEATPVDNQDSEEPVREAVEVGSVVNLEAEQSLRSTSSGWSVSEEPPSYDTFLRTQAKQADNVASDATMSSLPPPPPFPAATTNTPTQSPLLTPPSTSSNAAATNQLSMAMSQLNLLAEADADTDRLLIAVQLNDLASVQRLLPHEGDVEACSIRNRFTPLCWAAQAGNLEMVRCLIMEGAQVNATTPTGFTPLLLAASDGHADVVQYLLMKGADPEARVQRSGYTALLQASSKGYADVVRHLMTKRANLEARSADGSTALHLAASTGHAAVVQQLLVGGADLNATIPSDGSTALHLAAYMECTTVVWLLLRRGADPLLKNDKGCTAADQTSSDMLRRVLTTPAAELASIANDAWRGQWRLRGPVSGLDSTGGSSSSCYPDLSSSICSLQG